MARTTISTPGASHFGLNFDPSHNPPQPIVPLHAPIFVVGLSPAHSWKRRICSWVCLRLRSCPCLCRSIPTNRLLLRYLLLASLRCRLGCASTTSSTAAAVSVPTRGTHLYQRVVQVWTIAGPIIRLQPLQRQCRVHATIVAMKMWRAKLLLCLV
ncbi:hypothetical protein MRX96_017633 [Rhipicephalus microplus]